MAFAELTWPRRRLDLNRSARRMPVQAVADRAMTMPYYAVPIEIIVALIETMRR